MALPKQKLNPYHIKMEDETYGGNYDENRNFVLSNLTNHKVSIVEDIDQWLLDNHDTAYFIEKHSKYNT